MKSERTIMDILSTYDVVGTYRAHTGLGCVEKLGEKTLSKVMLQVGQRDVYASVPARGWVGVLAGVA